MKFIEKYIKLYYGIKKSAHNTFAHNFLKNCHIFGINDLFVRKQVPLNRATV
jgi:hypothetical protein